MSAAPNFRAADAARSRIDEALDWPVARDLPEVASDKPDAFPFAALGPILGAAAAVIADLVQAPDALAAGSTLAAAAAAVQPHADVMMPHGQAAPLSLFIATSAESGDRKSATDAVACAPIEAQRRREARAHALVVAEHKGRPKGEADELPPARSPIVSRATIEGLHHLLRSQASVGLFSTEGAELVGGHSMREERRSAGIAWLLKAWGAETLDALTRGDGHSVLIGRRVSLHVLLQPIILRSLLADPLAQGQGLIARCLVAAPATLAGRRLFRDDAILVSERPEVRRYHDRLAELLSMPVQALGDGSELNPRRLVLAPEARALWVEFYDETERQQAEGASLAGARAWASKFGEHAARIAGIVTVIGQPDAQEVTGEAMNGAIEVAAFYLGEHVRLMGGSMRQQHANRLHLLLEWMRGRGLLVGHADVLQRSPNQVRTLKAEGIGRLLNELADLGQIRRVGDRWEVRP
ncbi:MAG: DUF3987 domain-containing protein [Rubrivivax sp.]|nr:DUF3987 domain-containing protein [Rubrivivax sp.]